MYNLDVAFDGDDNQTVDRAVYDRRRHSVIVKQQAHQVPQNARLLPAIRDEIVWNKQRRMKIHMNVDITEDRITGLHCRVTYRNVRATPTAFSQVRPYGGIKICMLLLLLLLSFDKRMKMNENPHQASTEQSI